MPRSSQALRATVTPAADAAALVDAILVRAGELAVLGWVRQDAPGTVRVHAEGAPDAVQALAAFLEDPVNASAAEVTPVKVEGHEQFAVRGVSAGVFVVQEHQATAHHFDFRLEVDGVMRSWAVPRGPSLDPAAKRLAVQVDDHDTAHNDFEGAGHGGTYEQGGRVPWPEALDRGHAVFVLHGEKLNGGFALQRTRPGAKPQWLLVKRRDDEARPGSDIVAQQPRSVLSGRTLDEILDDAG